MLMSELLYIMLLFSTCCNIRYVDDNDDDDIHGYDDSYGYDNRMTI